jgi:uncharacterized protein
MMFKLRVFLRRWNKVAVGLVTVLVVVMVAFYGARFFIKKAGLPIKGEIHRAAGRGETLRVFFWLTMRPAIADERDRYRRTPLHVAAAKGKRGPATWLIFWGAGVNARDRDGQTPLHLAAYYDRADLVELLIRKGADVNARDGLGRTPLSQATLWNRKKAADVLRSYNAAE